MGEGGLGNCMSLSVLSQESSVVRQTWQKCSFLRRDRGSSVLFGIRTLPLTASMILGPAPIAQLVECPLRGTGGHGFDPGPRHTKVVKNGTSCSSLDTQTYGVELGLVDPVSG